MNDFTAHVVNTIGTPIVGKNGYIVPIQPPSSPSRKPSYVSVETNMFPAWSIVSVDNINMGYDLTISGDLFGMIDLDGFSYIVPVDARVTGLIEVAGITPALNVYSDDRRLVKNNSMLGDSTIFVAGDEARLWLNLSSRNSIRNFSLGYRGSLIVEPSSWNLPSFTVNVGGSVGRIGNSVVSVADSYNTIYQDVSFVDEINNTFYNPTTNETVNLSNWQYDYSTREYSLTTVDDRQINLRYGDDSITIREGDTVVNSYYYVVPVGGGDVEPTPPPEVSPAPSPSAPPAGDVGGDSIIIGDGSEGVGGIFKWFGNITVSIGDIFGNIFGGGSGSGEGGEDDGGGGILDWLWDGLGKIADAIFGGIGKVLESILKPIIDLIVDGITFIADSLVSIVDAAMQILDIIPNMLGGFADFLGSFFSFLPPEIADIFQILQVGILAVIIVILIRLFI